VQVPQELHHNKTKQFKQTEHALIGKLYFSRKHNCRMHECKCDLNTFGASVQNICTLKALDETLFFTTLQQNNLPDYWTRKLYKPSKDLASLLVCIEKNGKVLDFSFFSSNFFSMQTRRLAASFASLNSSLAQSACEL